MMIRCRHLILVVISSGWLFGCDNRDSALLSAEDAETTSDSIDSLSEAARPEVKLPNDIPADVPIFSPARPTLVFGARNRNIRFVVNDSATVVHDFYVRQLVDRGWELIHDAPLHIQAKKAAGRTIGVNLLRDGESQLLHVRYSVFPASQPTSAAASGPNRPKRAR